MSLSHPNVLRVLWHGRTPKGKRFLISQYCTGGSLECGPNFDRPIDGLRLFEQIVGAVAHAHTHEPAIYHLDIKPSNILLNGRTPVVGDFGICFVEEDGASLTKEGPRGSIYYCAPELRDPVIEGTPLLKAADVYSLGKVLYWLYTGKVFDGHEDDYVNDPTRRLARLFPLQPQFAFVDELVAGAVRRRPTERFADASRLLQHVRRAADRIDAGGRVLDLRVPQRCLYCAEGHYKPAHENVYVQGSYTEPKFPDIQRRRGSDDQSYPERSMYARLRNVVGQVMGTYRPGSGIPLLLICDYCGNVQYFRLDHTTNGRGENWLP
jgi:serine/threonine protein kinase